VTRVVIVGVGALGSHLALLARNLDVKLVLVDFDRVEQKNVLAQFHTRMGVGRNKAQALAQALQGMFGLKVEVVPHRLTADNTDAVLGKADVVVDCLDNGASRRLIQEWVRAHEVPCLHGALSADGQYGRAVWDELFHIDNEDVQGAPTCEGGEHLPFIAQVAAQLAFALQSFVQHGQRRSWDLYPGGSNAL
jgi:molybdopterin-synthase adenylyltransferase